MTEEYSFRPELAGADPSPLPDVCLFAVVGLRSAIVLTDAVPDGTTIAGGVQVQLNCDPDLFVATLRGIADSVEADQAAARAARLN